MFSEKGERQVKPEYHGRLIRIRGVVEAIRQDVGGRLQLVLDCGRVRVPVDLDAVTVPEDGIERDCVVEVTGVCVMDVENRRSRTHFPETDGFLLVPRTIDDIQVVSRPPWWTTARLLSVILVLLGLLVGGGIWVHVLNRLVERRSRELLKETAARVGAKPHLPVDVGIGRAFLRRVLGDVPETHRMRGAVPQWLRSAQ